jgi:TonB family protein
MQSAMLFSFYLELALKSAAMLGAAWLAVLVLRRRSAALRSLVWSVAFAAMLVLPLLSLSLPRWHVPFGGSLLSTGLVFQVDAQNTALVAPQQQTGLDINPDPPLKTKLYSDWRLALLIVWAAGSLISLSQMLLGLAVITIRRRRARPLEIADFAPMLRLLGIRRNVDLLESPAGSMPVMCGLFQPAVFIPADAKEWESGRRRLVLLHELAHIHRLDAFTHLLARITLALYWCNPLVWAAWREFLNEREQAADDLVLGLGTRASDYASQLLEIASSLQSPTLVGWASVPMARPSQLESRVTAILDPLRDRTSPRRASAVTAFVLALVILSPVAALQAKNDSAQSTATNEGNAASALLKQGDEAREQGKWAQAKSLYTQALNISGTGPEAAAALIHLGTVELNAKNYVQSMADFERAVAADASHAGEAKMWIAIVDRWQNNLASADTAFQEALTLVAPDSPSAVIIMKLRADLLKQQGRLDEAAALQNEADAIVKLRAEQAASQNQTPISDAYRIGRDVTAPVLLSKVEPQYATDARLAKYQGTVLLSVEIGVDGLAGNVKVIRGLGLGLDEKAIDAVHQWRFKPGVRDGQPVKVAAHVEVNFRLL